MSSNAGKPQIPSDMKAFNEKLIAEFRANHGKLSGPMAGREPMLLTTKGSKSGRDRTVVVGYRRAGDLYVMIASNNGSDAPPSWVHNLRADPIATGGLGPDTFKARARVATPPGRAAFAKPIDYPGRPQALNPPRVPSVAL